MKIKEKISKDMWRIIHEVLATDHTALSSTVVQANSKEEALEKFLKGPHKERKKYYKYLSDPKLDDVYPFKYYT